MTRNAVCCLLILGSGTSLACAAAEEPLSDDGRPAIDRSVSGLDSQHPSSWSCQRYGDVADTTGDSYDGNAVRRAEAYLFETVAGLLTERGITVEGEEPIPERWIGLLAEICVEAPDMTLEAAARRVADGLP